jgi:hypothetical protein
MPAFRLSRDKDRLAPCYASLVEVSVNQDLMFSLFRQCWVTFSPINVTRT